MQQTDNTTYHYIVTRYPDGRIWYEGYSDEQEARRRAVEGAEYVGTSLPADVAAYAHQQEVAFVEGEFGMRPLDGSEKQVSWARDIRFRYMNYLRDKDGDTSAKTRYHNEESERLQASWWINNRYALGVTGQASKYIAEGR